MNLEDPEWGGMGQRGKGTESLVDILGRLAVFDTLTWQELGTIEHIVHRRRFVTGEMVIPAFTPRSGLFAVVSGSVHVVRHLADWERLILDTLGEGELLGEFALLDDSPRSTSIISAEHSDLIGFFRSDLVDLMQTQPKMGFKILYRLAQIMSHRMQYVMTDLRGIRLTLMDMEKAS